MTDAKDVVKAVKDAAPEIKAGIQTSEFKILIGVVVGVVLNNLHIGGINLGDATVVALVGLAAIYIASRTHLKAKK